MIWVLQVCAETEIVGEETTWNTEAPRNIVHTEKGTQGRFHRTTTMGAGEEQAISQAY